MNKLSFALLSALTIGSLSLSAQTAPAPAPAAPSVAVTVTPSFASQYMFRGQRLGGPAFQPTVELGYGNLTGGVWANVPMKDKVVGQSDPEFDFYASYTSVASDTLSFVPGFTFYTYPSANEANGFFKLTFEPNLAVNYTISGVKFTPKIYYDFVLDGPTYEITSAYAFPLKDLGTELDFTATYGSYLANDFVKGSLPQTKAWGNYWLMGVAAPFQLTKESKLTLGFAYTKGDNAYLKTGHAPKSSNTSAVGRGVVTVSYSYAF
ncbi:MAG: hypothetical protein WCQ44_07605 [Opitutaceae bacterium]|jgi:uncharacterized protein (TIGR02001 family)